MTTPRLANHKKVIDINGQILIQAINSNATSIRAVARRCNISFNALSIAIRRNQWQTHLPLRTLTDICDCVGLELTDLLAPPLPAHHTPFRVEPNHRDHEETDTDDTDAVHRLAALLLNTSRPHTPSEIALTLGCTLETLDHLREELNVALEGSGIQLRFANDALYLTATRNTPRSTRDADIRNLQLTASRDRPYDNTTMRIVWEIAHGRTRNTYAHAEAPRVGQAMNMGLLKTAGAATSPMASEVLMDAFPGVGTGARHEPQGKRNRKSATQTAR